MSAPISNVRPAPDQVLVDIPDYVAPDGVSKITFTRVPTLDEVPYPVKMEPNLVVEFYSR